MSGALLFLLIFALLFPKSTGRWIAEIVDAYEKARAELRKGKPE